MLIPKIRVTDKTTEKNKPATDKELKHALLVFVVAMMVVQFIVSDFIIVRFAFADFDKLDQSSTLNVIFPAWMTATCVEIIGVILIMAKNLFPDKNKPTEQPGSGATPKPGNDNSTK